MCFFKRLTYTTFSIGKRFIHIKIKQRFCSKISKASHAYRVLLCWYSCTVKIPTRALYSNKNVGVQINWIVNFFCSFVGFFDSVWILIRWYFCYVSHRFWNWWNWMRLTVHIKTLPPSPKKNLFSLDHNQTKAIGVIGLKIWKKL